jgi:hypothetical protein
LFQHRRSTFATAICDCVCDLCALAERGVREDEQPARPYQIAYVRDDPLGARLYEEVVVELRQVFFKNGDLLGYDCEQRLERPRRAIR